MNGMKKYGIRRLGYHGASHGYVASCLDELEGGHYRAVSCHLGERFLSRPLWMENVWIPALGCPFRRNSQTNRSGDIDPFLIFHMVQAEGMPLEEVQQQMQTNGGLLGISGVSGDLRDILEVAEENERARLAVEIYCREIARYIGELCCDYGRAGCHCLYRGMGGKQRRCAPKSVGPPGFLGVCRKRQKREISCISSEESRVRACVIRPTRNWALRETATSF